MATVHRLLPLLVLLVGCNHPYRLRPATPMQARGQQVTAAVEWLALDGEPDNEGSAVVGVRVHNHGPRKLYFDVDRARLADLSPPTSQPTSQPVSTPALEVRPGNPLGAAVAGASIGRGLSGPGGTGLGTVAGAGLGLAAGVVLMLPVGIALAIDRAAAEARKHLDPGEEAVIPLRLSGVDLDDGRGYGLVLHSALQQPDLPPLPIVRPDRPHLGYGEPSTMRWIVIGRMGGGPLMGRTDDDDGAMGGIGLFFGPQFGRFSIGIGGTLMGAGALGAELRYAIPVARWLSLVPFAGHGYYWLVGGPGFNVGHGPWGGLEINFPVGSLKMMGWDVPGAYVGLYAQGGPVFLFEGQGTASQFQAGLQFALY